MPNNKERPFVFNALFSGLAPPQLTGRYLPTRKRRRAIPKETGGAADEKDAAAQITATTVTTASTAPIRPDSVSRGFPFFIPDRDISDAINWALRQCQHRIAKILENFLIRREYLPAKNKFAAELEFLVGEADGKIALQIVLNAGGDPNANNGEIVKLAFRHRHATNVGILFIAGGDHSIICDEDVRKAARVGWTDLAQVVRDAKTEKLIHLDVPFISHQTVNHQPQ